jgi:NAD(P)-dependent dehydrogenase (short-subunit alcohol dehydrogenase family)
MQITGISAIVTGGASGLGGATARRLAEEGAYVTIVDLPGSNGQAAAAEIGDAARFVAADVTEETQIRAAIEVATARAPLRAVVHCAGRGGDRTRILDRDGEPGSLDSFHDVIRTNLIGTYNVLRLCAAAMRRNDVLDGDRGACVLTASVAAFDGQIGQTSYTASKAAVHGMTLVAARDLASRQIRVNTIAPGTFDTPMLARLPDDLRQSLANSVPHPKRLGAPADYAHLAVALIANSYVNGETIRLDGGIRMAPQ